MNFFKKWFMSDVEPTQDERDHVDETKRELDQTRGEYRQAVLRVEAATRVMKTWENANRMIIE